MYHLIATIRPSVTTGQSSRDDTALQLLSNYNIDAIMIRIISRPAGLSMPQLRFQTIRCYGANRLPDLNLSHQIGDDQVSELASKPLHKFSLADLVRHGNPPLSPPALFASANFTLSLLPIRLAHRIHALRNLPYIVVANPSISHIYANYQHSLSTLLPYYRRSTSATGCSPINTLEEEGKFTEVLTELVETHRDTIPILSRGFLESRKYISPIEVTRFLDEHLRARIGTRLIAEQHIALHHSSLHPESGVAKSTYNGVIDTALRPADIINTCGNFVAEICELKYGIRPTWRIDGDPDTSFAYVPVHLEYICTELLKNAFRATVESGRGKEPVVITIAAELEDEDELAASVLDQAMSEGLGPRGAPGVTIRIRDRGGGIQPRVLPEIWSYSFSTFESDNDDIPGGGAGVNHPGGGSMGGMDALNNVIGGPGGFNSSIAGLGYGLPLSRAYAEYFGGGISVQSLFGWGCDVYLRLKGVGRG